MPFIQEFFPYILLSLLISTFSDYIPKTINVIVISSHLIVYIASLLYLYMDTYDGWWSEYRYSLVKQSRIKFFDMLPRVIRNNIIGILFYWFILFPISKNRGVGNHNANIYKILSDLVILFFIFDTIFYIFHRMLHHPYMYRFHKVHHSTFAEIGISTHYMSFIDYLIEVILPFWMSISMYNSCFMASLIFAVIGQLNGVISHSGYKFPFLPNPLSHQYHHFYFNKNYGTGGIWDYVFSTSK